jgi:steroid 5-alpha reductase family enzyme
MDYSTLVCWIAFAIICYVIAKTKGRNPYLAIAWGLLGGLIAVIVYLCIKGSPQYELEKAINRVNKVQKARRESIK